VLIVKYTPTGTPLWAKTWGGGGDEGVNRIAVGPDGYIYVTGGTDSFGAGWYDVFLLKLDTNGNLIWGTTWGGSSFEVGYDLGFDQTGNIYVAAESYSNGNCAVILKFSPSGGPPIWSASWKGPATYDSAYGIAVDSNFNVIITGTSWDYSVYPNHNSLLLVKFDSSGNYLWSENWITPVPGEDDFWGRAQMITTDSNDNILVGATHSSNCQNSDFTQCPFSAMALKLDAAGNFQWAETWGGSGFTTAGGIALDSSGHLLVSGTEIGPPQVGFVLSYDTAGDLLTATGWSDQQTTISSIAVSSAVSTEGSVAVVGTSQDNGGTWEAASEPSGSLPNSLVSNPYTVGTPTGQTSNPTNPTESQTGPQNTGGAFVTPYTYYLGNPPDGIDISCSAKMLNSGEITQLQQNGILYAVVKAPQFHFGTCGQNVDQIPIAQQQLTALIESGIKTAVYCELIFDTQCPQHTSCDGGAQVRRCLKSIESGQMGDLAFVALDVEDENNLGSTDAAVKRIKEAVQAIPAPLRPVIYTDRGQWTSITGDSRAFSSDLLWLAGNTPTLILTPPFDGWTSSMLMGKQYQQNREGFAGIPKVDLDVFSQLLFQ
jgi:hypothetical protein